MICRKVDQNQVTTGWMWLHSRCGVCGNQLWLRLASVVPASVHHCACTLLFVLAPAMQHLCLLIASLSMAAVMAAVDNGRPELPASTAEI